MGGAEGRGWRMVDGGFVVVGLGGGGRGGEGEEEGKGWEVRRGMRRRRGEQEGRMTGACR